MTQLCPAGRWLAVWSVTALALALAACGKYGPPVRSVREAAPVSAPAQPDPAVGPPARDDDEERAKR